VGYVIIQPIGECHGKCDRNSKKDNKKSGMPGLRVMPDEFSIKKITNLKV